MPDRIRAASGQRRGAARSPVRARDASEVGRLLGAGEIVELDLRAAEACGAVTDECADLEDALAAMGDPCEWGDPGA